MITNEQIAEAERELEAALKILRILRRIKDEAKRERVIRAVAVLEGMQK